MSQIDEKLILQILQSPEEDARKAKAIKRHEIYKDNGRQFIVNTIKEEFGQKALDEMRVMPLNILKKIINKRSTLYRKPPSREAIASSDQSLVDYYTEALKLDQVMSKAHRYFNLFSNTVVYIVPQGDELKAFVIPPYLYSAKENDFDPTKADAYAFHSTVESGRVTDSETQEDQEHDREYVLWSDSEHFTLDSNGNVVLDENLIGQDGSVNMQAQRANPIEMMPIVNLSKERDSEFWAPQGEDLVEGSLMISLGWSDLLTIIKVQGFSTLTIISEEEPKHLTVGINRAIWLKQREDGPTPQISYLQAQSRIAETKDTLMDLLGLLLSTNDMNPGSITGSMSGSRFNSGFHALIENADTLEAIQADKIPLRDAEREIWQIIAAWHNWLFDTDQLNEEARSLGRFSDGFEVNIQYAEQRPIESDQEREQSVQKRMELGLITRSEALKRLHPDMTEEQIGKRLKEIDDELETLKNRAQDLLSAPVDQDQADDEASQEQG